MPLYRNKGKTYSGAQRALIGKSGAPRSKKRYTLLITSQCRRATARIGGTIPSMRGFAPHSVRAPLGLRRNHYKARLSDCAVDYDCERYAHDKGHKDYRHALKHTVKQVERRTQNHVWVTGVQGIGTYRDPQLRHLHNEAGSQFIAQRVGIRVDNLKVNEGLITG